MYNTATASTTITTTIITTTITTTARIDTPFTADAITNTKITTSSTNITIARTEMWLLTNVTGSGRKVEGREGREKSEGVRNEPAREESKWRREGWWREVKEEEGSEEWSGGRREKRMGSELAKEENERKGRKRL